MTVSPTKSPVALYIDPPSPSLLRDRLFELSTERFHSSLARCCALLKTHLESLGVSVHTVDYLPDTTGVARNIYVSIGTLSNYRKLGKRPDTTLSAFFVTETPVVSPPMFKGLRQAQAAFKRVYSVCDDPAVERFVGGPFECRTLRWPMDIESVDEALWGKNERQFLVMINMNKLPRLYWKELFTERMRAVEFFSRTGEIDLYGIGWDKPSMRVGKTWVPWTVRRIQDRFLERWQRWCPDPLLEAARRAYRGRLETKTETLASYKFALCFENTVLRGWLTEKIFECFEVGTVPVYWGATDIGQLIPRGCFIDMRDFTGYGDLRKYLLSLKNEDLQRYRESARAFFASPGYRPFSRAAFVEIFTDIIAEDSGVRVPEA
ncbi:MAG: glycosyltransferase family 10 domain-containing protein [Planctomycetota bacterium]